jgi:hypothetical protein
MKYCFDSSALIDLGERHYPQKIKTFAPIWERLYAGIDTGDIISVTWVRLELEKKADEWRVEFLKRADGMFHMTESIEKEYANIVREIESGNRFKINKDRKRFLEGADPWLVALARSVGECRVVSAETKPLTSYGLGAVCDVLNVKHMSLLDFFKVNGI